jgi:hypothetical protein
MALMLDFMILNLLLLASRIVPAFAVAFDLSPSLRKVRGLDGGAQGRFRNPGDMWGRGRRSGPISARFACTRLGRTATRPRRSDLSEAAYPVMKLRDGLILTAIVGGLALMFLFTRMTRDQRVEPGSPEYDAYIDRYVAECLQKQWVRDVDGSGRAAPSDTEREAPCRAFVLQADRFNPDARPLKRR